MIKVGTVRQLGQEEQLYALPEEVRREVQTLVQVLDDLYGADRDIDRADGGYVLIALSKADVGLINDSCVILDEGLEETVDLIKTKGGDYLNILYLRNNEFGINVVMPLDIAPAELKRATQ